MGLAEREKRAAAQAAADLVWDDSTIGLGSGSTVAFFLQALSGRQVEVRCVATSPATEEAARSLGLTVRPFGAIDRLDMAVDGADEVTPDLWLVKGGGGAHTREKVVAAASARFVAIVSSDKLVPRAVAPVPLELLRFGLDASIRAVSQLGPVEVRQAPPTPDGNVLADYMGEVGDPASLSVALDSIPGVVSHGLFPPSLVSEVLVGRGEQVDRLRRPGPDEP